MIRKIMVRYGVNHGGKLQTSKARIVKRTPHEMPHKANHNMPQRHCVHRLTISAAVTPGMHAGNRDLGAGDPEGSKKDPG